MRALIVLALVAWLPRDAHAHQPGSPLATVTAGQTGPWVDGVSAEEQTAALALFEEANSYMMNGLFPKAVRAYEDALKHWVHPAFSFNLAMAYVNIDVPVAVERELQRAIAFGPAPIGLETFDRAKKYLELIGKQIGTLEVTVAKAAEVSVDGELVMQGPGTWSGRLRAGKHVITASLAGYLPLVTSVFVEGGDVVRVKLELYMDRDTDGCQRPIRRFDAWKPYAVLGAGAMVAMVGGFLELSAHRDFRAYDAGIAACAASDPSGGCSMVDPQLFELRDAAVTKRKLGFVGYGIGGAAVGTGVVLVVLNQPYCRRVERASVAPVVTSTFAGLSFSTSF